MKCSNCGREIEDGSTFCSGCGARMNGLSEEQRKALEKAGTSALAMGKAARAKRLAADYSNAAVVSDRLYNAVLIGVVLWGALVSALLCAAVGNVYSRVDPAVFLIGYVVLVLAGTVIATKSSNPLVSFLGFNMIAIPMGLIISTLVDTYAGLDPDIVTNALLYTGLISAGMMGAALAFSSLFRKLGGALLGCLFGIALCEILLLIFGVRQEITDWFAAALFSLYIGYDIYRSQQFVKTLDNAVDSALDIYLDIANLFIRLLSILARSKSKDD